MTAPSTLGRSATDDLIAKLEKATGPDRETDHLIHCARGLASGRYRRRDGQGSWIEYTAHDADGKEVLLPQYTTSIDAAIPGENIVKTQCFGSFWEAVHSENGINGPFHVGRHASEAIARRIAALKARAGTLVPHTCGET